MNLALNYDEQAPPSLQGFVTWLAETRREIKRDMEHGRGTGRRASRRRSFSCPTRARGRRAGSAIR
jgi:hypothetical protein